MVEKVPMTPGGFVKLQEELRWRQQEERPESSRRSPKPVPMATFPKTPNTTPPRKPRAIMKAASVSWKT